MSDERRGLARWQPERKEYVLFSIAAGQAFLCPLKDLSVRGMCMGGLGAAAAVLKPSLPISIDDCPRNLRNVLRWVRGEVAWAAGSRCGIRFGRESSVTNQELRELLDEPHPLPWADWSGRE